MKTAYFIQAMHRSGTSALGGTLNILGLDFGLDLMKASEDNPKGYYENNRVNLLNEAILKDSNSSWDDYTFNVTAIPNEKKEIYIQEAMKIIQEEFRYSNNFAIKDPRICMLFPIWQSACQNLDIDIKMILPYRNPLEVALSLKKRDGFSFEKSMLLWSKHTLDAELFSRGYTKIFISFDDIIKEKEETVQILAKFLDIELHENTINEVDAFLDKNIKHNNMSLENFTKEAPLFIKNMIEILKNKNFNDEKLFDTIRDDFTYSLEMFQHIEIEDIIYEQSKQIDNLSAKVEELENIADLGYFDKEFYTLEYPDVHQYEGGIKEHYFQHGKSEHRFPNAYCKYNNCDISSIISKDEQLYNQDIEINSLENQITQKSQELELKSNDIENLSTENLAQKEELELKSNDIENLSTENLAQKEELELKSNDIENLSTENLAQKEELELKSNDIENLDNEINKVLEDLLSTKESKNWLYSKLLKMVHKKLQKTIRKSALFDKIFYLRTYKDARLADISPIVHYITVGIKEDRKPNATFDPLWYKDYYEDVKENGTYPLIHFIKFGKQEGRFQNKDEKNLYDKNINLEYEEFLENEQNFDGSYPFSINEVLIENIKSIYDEDTYLEINKDVKKAVDEKIFQNGWEHFLKFGMEEIRQGKRQISPTVPLISEHQYVEHNEDIFNALKDGSIISPFKHFLLNGVLEYTNGSRTFHNADAVKYVYKAPVIDNNIKQELESFKNKPLISVVMPVYNVEPKWLQYAVDSLHNQWYENWELCIADDKSTNQETLAFLKNLNNPKIKIVFLEKNLNISGASNAALALAEGEYIALMDNDDELTPDAFYEVVKSINEKDAEFIYSDEDKLEMDGTFSDPHFKPDFAPDMFLSQNYLSHLGVIKKEFIDKVGGWEVGLEGAQDYDLYLKVLEHTDKIVHIDKVLYHWRKIPGSTAAEFSDKSYAQDAGLKALQNTLKRRNIEAEAQDGVYPGTYKVEYKIKGNPLVSVIIPFKDKPELLDMCINSVLDKSTYQNYEIIGISNNSEEADTFKMMEVLSTKDNRVSFYEYNVAFNYSDINNHAVNQYSKGEHILLLNNDIEIISPRWIEEMLMHSQRSNVGCVGAKLYYPDDTLQHAGVIVGLGGVAGHSHKYFEKENPGYFHRLGLVQNLSAVTAACLMVKQSIYNQIDGLDEENLKIAFNDVDFCLRVQEKGYLNIFTPYSEAYHHESISRGGEDSPEKKVRFNTEMAYIKERHKELLQKGDFFYNKNLTLDREDFSIRGEQ